MNETKDDTLVTVYLIEQNPDGVSKRIGNSHECSMSEAIQLISLGQAKAEHAPIGAVPAEWEEGKDKKRKAVGAEKVDGEDFNT